MIIDCPSCHTQFHAPDGVLSVPGRKLRCSSCGHVWAVAGAPPVESQVEETVFAVEDSPSAPPDDFSRVLKETIARNRAIPLPVQTRAPFWHLRGYGGRGYAAAAALAFLFILAMAVLQGPVVAAVPPAQAIYGLFGGTSVQSPLVIDQIRALTPTNDDRPDMLRIEGRIINLSEQRHPVPQIRIRLLGEKADQVISSWIFKPSVAELAREQSANFYSMRPVKDAGSVKHIEMRFMAP